MKHIITGIRCMLIVAGSGLGAVLAHDLPHRVHHRHFEGTSDWLLGQ